MADGSKTCRCCGGAFTSTDSRRVYCNRACRERAAREGIGRPMCSLAGCDRPTKAYGWCQLHYERWRASGAPGEAAPRRVPAGICEAEGCGKPTLARGMCRTHYYRAQREAIPVEQRRQEWRKDYHRRKDQIAERRRITKPAQQSRPCADCGVILHRQHVRADLPKRCTACQAARVKVKGRERGAMRRSCVTRTTCKVCRVEFDLPKTRKRGKIAEYCSECRKLRNRQRRAERRAKERIGDVTDAVLLALGKKRCCAMCRVVMTRGAGPKQRQIDHIVPLNVGGLHTPANLRAICRTCNYKRPKDGSDLSQMPLLLVE